MSSRSQGQEESQPQDLQNNPGNCFNCGTDTHSDNIPPANQIPSDQSSSQREGSKASEPCRGMRWCLDGSRRQRRRHTEVSTPFQRPTEPALSLCEQALLSSGPSEEQAEHMAHRFLQLSLSLVGPQRSAVFCIPRGNGGLWC